MLSGRCATVTITAFFGRLAAASLALCPAAAFAQDSAGGGAGVGASDPGVTVLTLGDLPPDAQQRRDAMVANARRFARIRTRADCLADAAATGDIVVCGQVRDESLPVPEAFGPRLPRTDGAAVDPSGVPCELTSQGCYEGVNLPRLAGATVKLIGLIFDPDANLGEGDPIPERFRGANR